MKRILKLLGMRESGKMNEKQYNAEYGGHVPECAHGMYSGKPAGKWDEAFPVGNGIMGVLAMGEPLNETLIFNHERLFLPLRESRKADIPDVSDLLPDVRTMIKEGKYAAATDYFLERINRRGFPSELIWTDPFHPAFSINIRMDADGPASGYRRWLDFEAGETGVEWNDNRGRISRNLFVSRECNAVVLMLRAPEKSKLNCMVTLSEVPGGRYIKSKALWGFDGWLFYRCLYEEEDKGYDGITRIVAKGGRVLQMSDAANNGYNGHNGYNGRNGRNGRNVHNEAHNAERNAAHYSAERSECGVVIQDVDEVLLITRIIPFSMRDASESNRAMEELAALPADYGMLLKRHISLHGELYNRVKLRLDFPEGKPPVKKVRMRIKPGLAGGQLLSGRNGETGEGINEQANRPVDGEKDSYACSYNNDAAESFNRPHAYDVFRGPGSPHPAGLSNEEYVARSRGGEILPEFVVKMFHYGRYLLISSSGEMPPNLQGVWNGSWSPPWSSDYTLDENLQMMMWQVLPGSLPELAQCYFNLVESFISDWKKNARLFYGCRGVLSSLRSSTSGLHKHFCKDYPMMFWTAGAGWLAQLFFDYWQHTGDDEFLKRRAIPYMKEVALFYEDFLQEGPDGKYEFIPSYSPENTPSNSDSPTAINATMDIAVAKELLSNLVEACEAIGVETENVPKWKSMLERMPDYLLNADGALKEWSWPGLEDQYRHRHSSHLYPIFPGLEASREKTPELFDACLKAAELRLTDGIEAITGWGLAHLANTAARLKNGNLAYLALSRIMERFILPNLFTCHNEGELFQMDANLGFTSALLEMLVFSKKGRLELLPALPDRFARGSVSGVLCRGRIRLHALEWDMKGGDMPGEDVAMTGAAGWRPPGKEDMAAVRGCGRDGNDCSGKYVFASLESEIDQWVEVKYPGMILSLTCLEKTVCSGESGMPGMEEAAAGTGGMADKAGAAGTGSASGLSGAAGKGGVAVEGRDTGNCGGKGGVLNNVNVGMGAGEYGKGVCSPGAVKDSGNSIGLPTCGNNEEKPPVARCDVGDGNKCDIEIFLKKGVVLELTARLS